MFFGKELTKIVEDKIIKRFPKSVLCLCLVILPIYLTLFCLALFTSSDALSDAFVLVGMLSIGGETIFACFFFYEFHNAFFKRDEIIVRWSCFTIKKIPYKAIAGIAMETLAWSGYGYPRFYGKERKPRGVFVLYGDGTFSKSLHSLSINRVPGAHGWNVLGSCFLKKHDLWALLCKTKVPIYITEQILIAHYEDLKNIVNTYSDRFVVAYRDKGTNEEKKASYEEYKKICSMFI